MKKENIDKFFEILSAQNPEPKTELEYVNPYTFLLAVVLSAQSTDVGVNKATRALFDKVKNPQQMLALGEEGLKGYVKTIGLYNSKAKNIIALSKRLVEELGFKDGSLPHDRDALQSLPGVGRKTANVVLNVLWGDEVIGVDTHIFRVANRIGLVSGKTPEEVEEKLLKVIPQRWMRHAHHWIVLHGRYVCKARAPDCKNCVVRSVCGFEGKGL